MKKVLRNVFVATLLLVLSLTVVLLGMSTEKIAANAAVGGSNTIQGTRIENSDIISDMILFPEHDQNNGCGMVAMGVLLAFYDQLITQFQGSYLPDTFDFWDASVTTTPATTQQQRANSLRDDITGRTPKFLGTIGSWFGAGNASVPSGQATGLNIYFDAYCSNFGITAYSTQPFPSYDLIIEKLDDNVPVLLTAMYFDFYDTANPANKQNTNIEEYHTMVAYG